MKIPRPGGRGAISTTDQGRKHLMITQNNRRVRCRRPTRSASRRQVGVDSQTTYEKAFIAAADKNENVEAVVLDAGGDVARQIAQIQDLIQQERRRHHHLADQRQGRDPGGSQGASGRHPGDRHQLQHRRGRPSSSLPPSPVPTTSRRARVRPRSCASSLGIGNEARSSRSPASRAIRPPSSGPRASRTVCPRSART
jgi:hypothetical protein